VGYKASPELSEKVGKKKKRGKEEGKKKKRQRDSVVFRAILVSIYYLHYFTVDPRRDRIRVPTSSGKEKREKKRKKELTIITIARELFVSLATRSKRRRGNREEEVSLSFLISRRGGKKKGEKGEKFCGIIDSGSISRLTVAVQEVPTALPTCDPARKKKKRKGRWGLKSPLYLSLNKRSDEAALLSRLWRME